MIFIRGTQGLAGPIRKITRSPYTHIAGLAHPEQVIESQALRITGYEHVQTYKGVADVYRCEELTDRQRKEIVEFARSKIGTRYDYLLFFWLAGRHLLGQSVPLIASQKRRICTTLWADAYRSVGIDLCPGIEYPTPGELANSQWLKKVDSY
ncbi:hypothetical protein ACOJUR_12870 [Alicyclobacillus tolerans]